MILLNPIDKQIIHSVIIEISPKKLSPNNYMAESDLYNDPVVNMFSDYFGGEVDDERRAAVLDELTGMLEGIAEVDKENGIIKNIDIAAAGKNLNDWTRKQVEAALAKFDKGESVTPRSIRNDLLYFKDIDFLFYFTGIETYMSADFISELAGGYHGNTLYISGILDYHC